MGLHWEDIERGETLGEVGGSGDTYVHTLYIHLYTCVHLNSIQYIEYRTKHISLHTLRLECLLESPLSPDLVMV